MSKLMRVLILTSAAAIAIAAPQQASAGTLYQSKNCNASGQTPTQTSAYCYFSGQFTQSYQTYCRFGTVGQYSWYPSHRVDLWTESGTLRGGWTSARFAYSPVAFNWWFGCTPWMNSSSTEVRTYSNQLYIGTY